MTTLTSLKNKFVKKSLLFSYSLLLLFTTSIFYLGARLASPQIHAENTIKPDLIVPWLRNHINLSEGNELSVFTIGIVLYLAIHGYYLYRTRFKQSKKKDYLLESKAQRHLVQITTALAMLPLVFISDVSKTIYISIVVLSLAWIYTSQPQINKYLKLSVQSTIVFLIIFLIIKLRYHLSIIDFDFIIAPALKSAQGEPLYSFYSQYNLLLNLITQAAMYFNLRLEQISIVIVALYAIGIAFYMYIAKKIINNPVLEFIFIIAIIIFRYFSHTLMIIQVTPARLELWLPIIAVALQTGIRSRSTVYTVAAVYILDNHFGLLYALGYIALMFGWHYKSDHSEQNSHLRHFTNCLVESIKKTYPILLAGLINLYLFHSPISIGSLLYNDIKIDFIPISQYSLFWIILMVMGVYVYHLFHSENKSLDIYLLIIAQIQLLYFLGRSPENNLLNISGIFLLIIFILIKKYFFVTSKLTNRYILVSLCIALSSTILSSNFTARLDYAMQKNKQHPLDQIIDQYPHPFPDNSERDKTMIIGLFDGYLNYRYQVKQQGYFAPFWANIYNRQTAEFLTAKLHDKYRIFYIKDSFPQLKYYFDHNFEPDIKQISSNFEIREYPNTLFNEVILNEQP